MLQVLLDFCGAENESRRVHELGPGILEVEPLYLGIEFAGDLQIGTVETYEIKA